MLTTFVKRNPRRFWKWFERHEQEFLETDKNNYQRVYNKIYKCLEKFNPYLGFEIIANSIDGKREFVVTANGNSDLFDIVYLLIDTAPNKLKDRWIFTALRQPTVEEVIIHFENKTISSKDIFYELEESETEQGKIDIFVYITGLVYGNDKLEEFILETMINILDVVIGEYTNATRISELILVEKGELDNPKNISHLRKDIEGFNSGK